MENIYQATGAKQIHRLSLIWQAKSKDLAGKIRQAREERNRKYALFGKRRLYIIKGLFEATTTLHDEVHVSVQAEKMKIFWLCSKNKFLSSVPYLNLTPQYNNA